MKFAAKVTAGIIAVGFFILIINFVQETHMVYGTKITGESFSSINQSSKAEEKTEEKWMETFLFVRDQIRFEPTTLFLKFPQDVLWSRSGNAKEQSSLLIELLRENGEETRYASGTLEDETSRSLIQSMFPQIRDFSYSDDVPLYFPSQKKDLVQAVKTHYWVQIFKNDQWIDLDPSFPDAKAGQTYASLDNTDEEMDEDFFPEMSITLELEKGRFEENRVFDLESETVLEWEGTLQEIANQSLYLKILANIQAVEEDEGESPMGGMLGGLGGRKTTDKDNKSKLKNVEYRASLHLVDDELDYGSFSQTVSDGKESEEAITKITIKFKMENSEGEPMEVDRILFEKFEKDQQPHYFQRHSILFAKSEIPVEAWERDLTDFMDSKDLDELKKNLDTIKNQLKDKKDLKALLDKSFSLENELGPEAGHMINMIFASTSDHLSNDLADALSVYSYYSLPRIIINSFEGTGEELRVSLDLRQDKKEAIPFPGQAEQMSGTFLYGRGVLESILEGKVIELLTGKESLTTARLMQIAGNKNIPIRIFSNLEIKAFESLNLPFAVAQKARSVIDSGHILIIPEQTVEFNGMERWGWWDLDPEKGSVIGVLESGLHQAVLERTIMDTTGMLHDDMGLVIGAIVGCVDTHWVLFALILEYGELDKAALQEAKDYMKNIGGYLCPGFEKTAGVGVGVSVELEDCLKKEIGIGFSGGLKIEQGWCAKFAKGFQCASTSILNFYLMHAE
jgi:hypothetical protein